MFPATVQNICKISDTLGTISAPFSIKQTNKQSINQSIENFINVSNVE